MLTGHKPIDISDIRNRLATHKPDTMITALEHVNGHAANPDIFQNLLTPIIEAVSDDLADNAFCQSAAQSLKQFPEKAAAALLEKVNGSEPDKALGALLQLDLLVIDTVCNKEGKKMDSEFQKNLITELEKLLPRTEYNISIVAGNILNNLHHHHNREN